LDFSWKLLTIKTKFFVAQGASTAKEVVLTIHTSNSD
jgi:hypothetical protein